MQVYIGSFNSGAPINAEKNPHFVEHFEAEQAQLLHDLYEISSMSLERKVGLLRMAHTCRIGGVDSTGSCRWG